MLVGAGNVALAELTEGMTRGATRFEGSAEMFQRVVETRADRIEDIV